MSSLVDALSGARQVSPLPPYQLEVELRSGETVFLDLETLIRQRDAYWKLRQSRYFAMVSVDPLEESAGPKVKILPRMGWRTGTWFRNDEAAKSLRGYRNPGRVWTAPLGDGRDPGVCILGTAGDCHRNAPLS